MIPNAVYFNSVFFFFSSSLPHSSHLCTQTITIHQRILPWLGRYVVKNLVMSIFTISELIFYSYSSFYHFSVIRGGNSTSSIFSKRLHGIVVHKVNPFHSNISKSVYSLHCLCSHAGPFVRGGVYQFYVFLWFVTSFFSSFFLISI